MGVFILLKLSTGMFYFRDNEARVQRHVINIKHVYIAMR
jgi:hypothetical protein